MVVVEYYIGPSTILELRVMPQKLLWRDIWPDMAKWKDFCKTNQSPIPAKLRMLESAF